MNTAPRHNAPDDVERIRPDATPGRVAVACLPILGITATPPLPFASTPTFHGAV